MAEGNGNGNGKTSVASQGDEIIFDLVEMEECSGEQALKNIAEMTYGAGAANRTSFCAVLCRRRGSVIVKVVPISLVGALIALILVVLKTSWECPDDLKAVDDYDPKCWLLPELKHPFVVQIFGIILSFVIVARNNVATDRYFDGMDSVHTMSSRWVDSFTSLMGFLRASIDLHPAGSKKQEACVALGLACLHWGTLAHALAINSLQATQLGLDEKIWEHRLTVLEPPENLSLDSGAEYSNVQKTKSQANKSRARVVKGAMTGNRRVSITETGVPKEKQDAMTKRELGKLGVYGKPSKEEVSHLHGATDKVAIVLMWMEEAVSRAQVQGVLLIAPPILGRVYNELGSGLEGFNAAYRIALVPFPFCFAQMIGWCLVIFVLLCPAVAFVFTGGEFLTSALTFFSLMGFWGLNRIAIELENPFGDQVNHLPLAELHHAYVEAIGEMHIHPMPEYKWNTGAGMPTLPQLRRNLAAPK